jgi:Toxin PAAR-like domain
MSCTVFANGQGFFHKGSGGKGQAFPDVCLSPPPPPAGPVPVPYLNSLTASDLSNGSTTVKIQGEPTGKEDSSYVSTSTGDEGGTQGGGVVTHKTKGKGYFTLWSFDVKVEGKGADRHGDPMLQNCSSPPGNGLNAAAVVTANIAEKAKIKCCPPKSGRYSKKNRYGSPTDAQKAAVKGGPCWECKSPSPRGWKVPPRKKPPPPQPGVPNSPKKKGKTKNFVADHQPPLLIAHYAGGCADLPVVQEVRAKDTKTVKPHCTQCSSKQGGAMSGYSTNTLKKNHGC